MEYNSERKRHLRGSEPSKKPISISSSAISEEKWHVHIGDKTYGPFDLDSLKKFISDGRINATTNVCKLGASNWILASRDPILQSLFHLPVSADVPMPPVPQPSAPVYADKGATIVQITNQVGNFDPLVLGEAKPKSAGVALLLSFIFVGAGQLYNGHTAKGILMFFGCIILWIFMLGWIINIWSMIDAYTNAKDMNDRYLRLLVRGAVT